MQFPSIYITVLLCIIGSTTNYVKGQTDQVPRIVFNGPGSCTATENVMIDDIFKVPERRSLIRSRSMQYYRAFVDTRTCSKVCSGYARGTCRSSSWPICNGFRRLNDERNLETSCEILLETYQSKLDTLRNNVSTSCSSFIGDRNSRTAECLDEIEYGEIVAARLWKIDSKATSNNTILQERLNATGYSFCKGTPITIEAINDPCVKEASMQLIGPNGFATINRIEYEIPYTLFGDTHKAMRGKTLRHTGTYTLKIKPDNDFTKTKTWQFVVNAC